jgi:hypothetical protein
MLAITGHMQRLCDGMTRRDFLRVGGLGALGISWPTLLRASTSSSGGDRHFGRARKCILLFLTGGPPQHETWDPKPDAPAEIRGEGRSIATSVTGIRVGELFPRVARHADKICLVRSVTHIDTIHTSAGYTMLTGMVHVNPNSGTARNIHPSPNDHPHIGSLLARVRSGQSPGPVFAALPEIIKDNRINIYPGQSAGFLGARYDPFLIERDAGHESFLAPEIALSSDITTQRLSARRTMSSELDRAFRAVDASQLDTYRTQAFDMLRAPAVRRAFDLETESPHVRAQYGTHLFGKGCLLARRLLEAGVALVTVYWHHEEAGGQMVWDTHGDNFLHLRNRLAPPTDRALAALLADLTDRGLLEETLVICMGEFGRSPRINAYAGRDHWPDVFSVLLAGAGLRAGSVYGASDRIGGLPEAAPVSPADLTATCLHLLGVPLPFEIMDRTSRPLRACEGQVVRGLLS